MKAPVNPDYAWMVRMRQLEGLAEVSGPGSNPVIKQMWLDLPRGQWYWAQYGKDDSKLPWCGMGAAHAVRFAGLEIPVDYASARAWLKWGDKVDKPFYGCVAVFGRGETGGHVGFVAGVTSNGRLLILGANQRDKICVVPFEMQRVLGFRFPSTVAEPRNRVLPVYENWSASSTNES